MCISLNYGPGTLMTVFHLCSRRFTANKKQKKKYGQIAVYDLITKNDSRHFVSQPNDQMADCFIDRRARGQCVAGSSDAHKKMCMFVCAAVIKLAMQTHVFYENRLFGMDLGGTVSVLPDQLQHPISVPVSIPVPSSQFQFQFPALVPVSFSVWISVSQKNTQCVITIFYATLLR